MKDGSPKYFENIKNAKNNCEPCFRKIFGLKTFLKDPSKLKGPNIILVPQPVRLTSLGKPLKRYNLKNFIANSYREPVRITSSVSQKAIQSMKLSFIFFTLQGLPKLVYSIRPFKQ